MATMCCTIVADVMFVTRGCKPSFVEVGEVIWNAAAIRMAVTGAGLCIDVQNHNKTRKNEKLHREHFLQ